MGPLCLPATKHTPHHIWTLQVPQHLLRWGLGLLPPSQRRRVPSSPPVQAAGAAARPSPAAPQRPGSRHAAPWKAPPTLAHRILRPVLLPASSPYLCPDVTSSGPPPQETQPLPPSRPAPRSPTGLRAIALPSYVSDRQVSEGLPLHKRVSSPKPGSEPLLCLAVSRAHGGSNSPHDTLKVLC